MERTVSVSVSASGFAEVVIAPNDTQHSTDFRNGQGFTIVALATSFNVDRQKSLLVNLDIGSAS